MPVRYKPSKAEGESLDVVCTPLPSDVCSSEVWLSLSEGTIWPFSEKEREIPAAHVDHSDGIYRVKPGSASCFIIWLSFQPSVERVH